ncbi:MAG: hypothetical protein QXN32_03335, partial [Candidatus Nitrosocaldus sp.]
YNIAAAIITMLILTIQHAYAWQPYVAGYADVSTYYKVTRAWMHSNYVNSNPADIECLIQSVLSSAGGTGTDRTGWIYQVGSILYGSKPGFAGSCGPAGYIYGSAEVWYGSTLMHNPDPNILEMSLHLAHTYLYVK